MREYSRDEQKLPPTTRWPTRRRRRKPCPKLTRFTFPWPLPTICRKPNYWPRRGPKPACLSSWAAPPLISRAAISSPACISKAVMLSPHAAAQTAAGSAPYQSARATGCGSSPLRTAGTCWTITCWLVPKAISAMFSPCSNGSRKNHFLPAASKRRC